MKMWKILGVVAGLLVLAAFGVAASFFQAQLFVHNPPEQRTPIDESPADYGLDYEQVTLTTEDGYRLAAWYVPSRNRAAIIVQHGYKGNRAKVLYVAEMLARHGYGVMMVDLRAHGQSDGDLISFGLYEVRDLDAAYDYLLRRPDVAPERIGALGTSMGGVVVLLYAAQNPEIKAVVSESAFVSLEDEVATAVAQTGLPAFPLAPVVQWFAEHEAGFEVKTVAAVERIGAISPRPVFLMQGGVDRIVPFDSGQRLYDAAGEPRELWFEPDVGHAAFGAERAEEYEARVAAFFDRYLLGE
jgi:fermentation-respiration switch protein FrsA (DUF1100 family)